MKIISIYLCLWFISIEKLIAEECSNSKTNNWIAISTDCSKEKCPVPIPERLSLEELKNSRRSDKTFSKVCTNHLDSHQEVLFGLRQSNSQAKRPIDFRTNCGFDGNACKSRITIVDYQQCYPG